jgi:hypothetical protein
MDTAYHVDDRNLGDVVINASYVGVLPARFMAPHRPRGIIGLDCLVGKNGSGIAGLWYLEALSIAAATVATNDVSFDPADVYSNGRISHANAVAQACGVEVGMGTEEAARAMLAGRPRQLTPESVTNRKVVETLSSGRQIVCLDSMAFALPEDRDNVLCTGGHAARVAWRNIERAHPWGFICNDGGRGREDSGIAGLAIAAAHGIAAAAVDARNTVIGNGESTYIDGVISAVNAVAAAAGVEIGQPAVDAARHLLQRTA